jgi:hypothetical protein
MPTNSNKYSLKNRNKNETNIHDNGLQYEVHSYTTRVLSKMQRNGPQYVQHEDQSSPKNSLAKQASPH